jgi:GT2 family glycosyltransferase
MHIEALAVCHNRKEKTLKSIYDLKNQNLPNDVTLSVTIVDDNSTDLTKSSIEEKYPDVEVISGTGELFWAGGMRHGWEQSIKNKKFDALLVFNDDITLNTDAIQVLIDTYQQAHQEISDGLYVITGAFTDTKLQKITYGGFNHSSKWHKLRFSLVSPNGICQEVDTLNMNFALISKESLNKVGFLSSYFRHGGADMDFGLKLRKFRGKVFLTPRVVGVCDRNLIEGTSSELGIGYFQRIKRLLSIKEQPIKQRFLYFRDNAGSFWFILFLLPYFRVFFWWGRK